MAHFEKAPTLDPVTLSSGKLDQGDQARQEIFSVPSNIGSERDTTRGDARQTTAWAQDVKQPSNLLQKGAIEIDIPPVAADSKQPLRASGVNHTAEEQYFARTTIAQAGKDASEKRVANPGASSTAALSKEHPSPLVSGAAFEALRRDVGVDLTKPGAFSPDPKNPEQLYFTDRLPKAVEMLSRLPKGVEIKGKASREVGPVNDFLKREGFDIKLEDQKDPRSLYLAGTLKVTDEWNGKARKMEANDGKTYDSVRKRGTVLNVDGVQMAEIHNNPEKGIKVYAIPMSENLPGYEVNRRAEELIKKIHEQGATSVQPNKNIEFPMVDMNSSQDITGIVGMGASNSDLFIKQAKMQTIVQMDESGFLAKQAAAIGMMPRSANIEPPVDFQVKDKFIFAVATTNGEFVFASQIGQENWKAPPKKASDSSK